MSIFDDDNFADEKFNLYEEYQEKTSNLSFFINNLNFKISLITILNPE